MHVCVRACTRSPFTMHKITRIQVDELNPHLICVLCGGYFIDATTIIECLHSFCRTCIVRYLESSKYCPICDVQVHKTRPLENIRADKTLQNLVYKLVPSLFEDEMRRRRGFYQQHRKETRAVGLEDRGEAVLEKEKVDTEENISLCLELSPNGRPPDDVSTENGNKAADRRYLLCPMTFTVELIKKFVRMKFSLSDRYQIDVFHSLSDEVIPDCLTLMDIAYIYTWRRKAPLRLFYTVYENPAKKLKVSGKKNTGDVTLDEKPTGVRAAETMTSSDEHFKHKKTDAVLNGTVVNGFTDTQTHPSPLMTPPTSSSPSTVSGTPSVSPVETALIPKDNGTESVSKSNGVASGSNDGLSTTVPKVGLNCVPKADVTSSTPKVSVTSSDQNGDVDKVKPKVIAENDAIADRVTSPGTEDRANNNIVPGCPTPALPNGHLVDPYDFDGKTEPLDLSETACRKYSAVFGQVV